MAQRGGYRKPNNPAPVSGPGRLSRRTDGNPTQGAKYMSGGQYGEGQALMETQKAAPMASKPATPTVSAGAVKPPLRPLLESGNPNTPLTQGLPYGPGAGPEVASRLFALQPSFRSTVERLRMADMSGEFDDLAEYLDSRGIS